MAKNPYEAYKKNAIKGSSGEQLVIMLVDGAVKYTKVARLALEAGDKERAHKELVRVQEIFVELIYPLSESKEDFAINLISIYGFIRSKLIEANIKKDIKVIDEIMPVIEDVRDMWHEIKRDCDLNK